MNTRGVQSMLQVKSQRKTSLTPDQVCWHYYNLTTRGREDSSPNLCARELPGCWSWIWGQFVIFRQFMEGCDRYWWSWSDHGHPISPTPEGLLGIVIKIRRPLLKSTPITVGYSCYGWAMVTKQGLPVSPKLRWRAVLGGGDEYGVRFWY